MSGNIKTKTIRNAIIRYSMIIAVLVLITTSMTHIVIEIKDYYGEVNFLKEEFFLTKKEDLMVNVEEGISIINSIKKQYDILGRDMKQAKQDTISILEGLESKKEEYLFIGTYEGISLLGPAKNRSVMDCADVNGKKFVEEIIHTAKAGGGYVDYVIPQFDNKKSGNKLSYVKGIDDWNWYVGSGIYVDEIESTIDQKRSEVLKKVLYNVVIMLSAAGLLLIMSRIISNNVSISILKSVEEFTDFFNKAKYKDNKINLDKIEFEEFKKIGEMANEMLDTHSSQSEKIWKLAYYDELTNLPNRLLFSKMIEEKIMWAQGEGNKGTIFYIDVDNFHNINNLYGQVKGDELLKKIADRLNKIQHNNLIGRISGDEFVVMIDGIFQKEMIQNIADLLIKVFETPFRIDENIVYITASIGIAFYPEHGNSVDEILGNANTATQKSKELGKNQFFIYDGTLSQKIKRKMLIQSCLKKALVNNEFELYYQPQIEFKTGHIVGFEALLRWPKFEYGSISPLEFIPIAEESGQIISIGNWVLRNACIFARDINKGDDQPLTVAVNISAIQLLQYDFVENVMSIIRDTGVDPQNIAMELTETAILSTVNDSSKKLKKIIDLGIKVYLDDFGIGYSSLSYLRNLPFHGIKIDRSFISGDVSDKKKGEFDSTIIKTIISMASALNLATIAEGIETEFQKRKLNDYGCRYAQGFLFGKPLPKLEVVKLLKHTNEGMNI